MVSKAATLLAAARFDELALRRARRGAVDAERRAILPLRRAGIRGPRPAGRVILFETENNGHHLPYVRLLLERLIDGGIRPIFCTAAPVLKSPEFQRDIRHLEDRIDIWTLEPARSRSRWATETSYLIRMLRRCARHRAEAAHDVVLIPDVDRLLGAWLAGHIMLRRRGGSVAMRGLLMRPESFLDANRRAAAKRFLLRAAIRLTDTRIFGVTGPLAASQQPYSRLGVTALSDPLFSATRPDMPREIAKLEARQRLDLPADQTLVMVLGTLAARKNLPLVMECFRRELPSSDCLAVIAGKADHRRPQAMRELEALAADSKRILLRLGLLSDAQFADYLAAADALLLLYDNRAGASGMLSHAIEAQLPVVAYGNTYCEDAVRRFRLGAVLERLDPQSLATAIGDVVSATPTEADQRLQARARELVRASRSGLGEQFLNGLVPPR